MIELMLWMDELDRFRRSVPEPKRGGTWLYCPWTVRRQGEVTSCLFRTRHWRTYRTHWRRAHR